MCTHRGGTPASAYRAYTRQLITIRDTGKQPAFLPGTAIPGHDEAYRAFNDTYSITPALQQLLDSSRENISDRKGLLTLNSMRGAIGYAYIGNGTPTEIEVARKQALYSLYRQLNGEEALAAEIKKMK